MNKKSFLLVGLLVVISFVLGGVVQQPAWATQEAQDQQSKISIVWTSGDRDVALKMVFMYAHNAKRREWVDEVELIVWGPSSKLLANDLELQQSVAAMQEAGVIFKACKACSDSYGVSEQLEALGVEVKYMGVELTERVTSSEWHTLTF